MFKKRTLKTGSATKRREASDTSLEDVETSVFSAEIPVKRTKTQALVLRDIDYSKSPSHPEKSTIKDALEPSAATEESVIQPATAIKKAVGPKAAPKNVRVTTLTDFQPDVCKDFQQTGYCGYGDTCKFLHIRDELRQKKPVEKEWETVKTGSSEVAKADAEDVPFKCPICKKDYENPVKTACDHIFCKNCFMRRFKEEKKRKCFICKKDTGGSVQPVKNVPGIEAS